MKIKQLTRAKRFENYTEIPARSSPLRTRVAVGSRPRAAGCVWPNRAQFLLLYLNFGLPLRRFSSPVSPFFGHSYVYYRFQPLWEQPYIVVSAKASKKTQRQTQKCNASDHKLRLLFPTHFRFRRYAKNSCRWGSWPVFTLVPLWLYFFISVTLNNVEHGLFIYLFIYSYIYKRLPLKQQRYAEKCLKKRTMRKRENQANSYLYSFFFFFFFFFVIILQIVSLQQDDSMHSL